jgi:hypothetical protein
MWYGQHVKSKAIFAVTVDAPAFKLFGEINYRYCSEWTLVDTDAAPAAEFL